MISKRIMTIVALLLTGCATNVPNEPAAPAPPDAGPVLAAPPWHGEAPPSAVPRALLEQWNQAENRDVCAPVAFASVGADDATPRPANFSGGWGVAWDLPDGPGVSPSGAFCENCGRGAFGLAGTGVEPTPDTYDQWEYQETFSDGSRIGYGPRDEQWLAYVQIAGQRCLYNVWSYRGREHLELLIDQMRMVPRD